MHSDYDDEKVNEQIGIIKHCIDNGGGGGGGDGNVRDLHQQAGRVSFVC